MRQRIRYRFDNSLARGPMVLIGWLGCGVLAMVVVAAMIGHFFLGGSQQGTFMEEFWKNITRVLGTGAFGRETAWPTRLVGLAVTMAGIFVAGSLIGLIKTALDRRVQDLSKGRSRVLETDHTLILGWSDRLPAVVAELVIANEKLNRPAVVIMAPRDIAEMDAELRDRVGATKNTKVVCRCGDPARPADLALVNVGQARSVIVLAGEAGDAGVVKAVMSLRTLDPDFSRAHVVAELVHSENAEAMRAVTEGAVATVNSEDVIAQVTAQACHQSGLSHVFQELLSFKGHELYFTDVPELVGHTYREALLAFPTSSVIGRYGADGFVELNPPPDSVFDPGDQVIAASEHDDSTEFGGIRDIPVLEAEVVPGGVQSPIRVLVVGWSPFGPEVVKQLDKYLAPGSEIQVRVETALADTTMVDEITLANASLNVSSLSGGPKHLQDLARGEPFDQIIILSYRGGMSVEDADSRTLLSLLGLRKMWPGHRDPPVRITAQLLDQTNAELAVSTGVDDFIVSDALGSLMLAQLSKRAELQAVFDDLFDPEGAVVELRPAHQFVPDATVAYDQIVAAGAAQSVSVLGWRIHETAEVVVNPPKHHQVHLAAMDQVLVVGLRSS